MSAPLSSPDFTEWIAGSAEGLDLGAEQAAELLPRLAAGGLTGAGAPAEYGGSGGGPVEGLAAISEAAAQSLTAAFVLWGQRSFLEYLLQGENAALRESLAPDLAAGRVAGATALSNAMKNLAGLEPLQISGRAEGGGFRLEGAAPWVTNLRPEGFHVAVAADRAEGGPAFVASLAHDDPGLTRSPDLELMAMRGSNTAALKFAGLRIDAGRIIAHDAPSWLPRVRPAFIGLQCGLSIGLARRALAEAAQAGGAGRGVLAAPVAEARRRLDQAENRLVAGLRSREFEAKAPALFRLRIEFAEIAAEALALELQASGGKAYLSVPGRAFARRWREGAFIPVVTPSLAQLKTALARLEEAA